MRRTGLLPALPANRSIGSTQQRRPKRVRGGKGTAPSRRLYGKGESLLRDAEISDVTGIPTGSITTIAHADVVPLFTTVSAPMLFTFINALRDRYLFNRGDVSELAKATGVMAPALLQVCPWFEQVLQTTTSTTKPSSLLSEPSIGLANNTSDLTLNGGTPENNRGNMSSSNNSNPAGTATTTSSSASDQLMARCRRRRDVTSSLADLQVQDPSHWLHSIEYVFIPESVQEWEDVLFTLTNHPCFHNGATFLTGHTALISVLAAYSSASTVVASRDETSMSKATRSSGGNPRTSWLDDDNVSRSVPYTVSEWQAVDGRGNPIVSPARSNNRRAPNQTNQPAKSVLQIPFGPRLMRKLRQKYISMQRVREFSELFRTVVCVEQSVINGLMDPPGQQCLVPAVGCDREHLVFFAAIHGRRECTDTKVRRWEDTIANVRTAVPLALAVSQPDTTSTSSGGGVRTQDATIDNLAKVASNVGMFLANDNAEEHRAVSLVRAICDVTENPKSGAVPLGVLTAFVEALYTAAVDKLRVTKGASLASTLCVISFTQTCRHIIRLTPNGLSLSPKEVALLRADFTASLLPTNEDAAATKAANQANPSSTKKGSSSTPPSTSTDNRMLKLDMLERSGLALLAPISRKSRVHVDMLTAALRDVLNRLSEVAVGRGRRGQHATVGQCGQVLEWLDAQIKLCTPIPRWTDVQELRTVILSTTRHTVRGGGGVRGGYGRNAKQQYHSDDENNDMSFRSAMFAALEAAGGGMLAKERAFVWTCGCGAANPIESVSCWSCVADEADKGRPDAVISKCKACTSTIDGSEATVCVKCQSNHPRDAALKEAGLWYCGGCTSVSSNSKAKCEACGKADPTRIPHTCPGCASVTIGHKPLMCTTCGWADATKNVRLWVCSGCQRMNPTLGETAASTSVPPSGSGVGKDLDGSRNTSPPTATSPTPQCTFCLADGGKVVNYDPAVHESFNAFQWVCGCGERNSPTSLKCRGCTEGIMIPSATHTCPSCHQVAGVTAKHKIDALSGMCFCSNCRTELHPRDATMVARRLTVCPACHGITPTASESCLHCKANVPTSLTRFLPTFADLPWTCHSCGGQNSLHMQDGESGLVCTHCEVDRISPLLFSEREPWDCNTCGFKRNYGFSCSRCRTLHSSVPATEVPLWTCTECKRHNFSWKRKCVNPSCTAAKPTSQASQLRYQPWQCPKCQFNNGPQIARSCGKCRTTRPPADMCELCGDSHLSFMCSGTEEAGNERLERLKEILLAAAVGDDATADGEAGSSSEDPEGVKMAAMFLENPPAFEFEESTLVELPMMWM